MKNPYSFDEFFTSNQQESLSPFLKPHSRKWGKNLPLISSILACFLLGCSFGLSYYSPSLSSLLLVYIYFLVGTPAFIKTVYDLIHLEINIEVLMTLAAFLSILIGSAFEGALLLILFEFSASMESVVTQTAQSNLFHLHQISPRMASVMDAQGHLYEKAANEVQIGDKILVKAGEVVPLDGTVIEGSSYVNLVHLTGESQPIPKTIGDEVPSGAGNLDGTLTLSVTRNSTESTVSTIIKLIQQAQESKPRIERFLDRFGKKYAPTIIVLTAFFAFALPYIFHIPYLGKEGSIYRALAFLIAASPCALIIATPTAYLSAMSSYTRRGVLLKGGAVLDGLVKCRAIAIDKTGTLTTGKLSCQKIEHIFGPFIETSKALSIAASLEKHAVHPIAEAIVDLAKSQKIELLKVEKFRAVPGYGLEAVIQGSNTAIGHADFIQKKTDFPLKRPDQIVAYLWVEGSIFVFHFNDTVKTSSKATIARLKKLGLDVIMLSGDHKPNVEAVAKKLEISTYFADLRPEDKLLKIQELLQKHPLIMVGDGINDAPALAQATIGISMGKIGSGTAIDASDLILLHDDISLLDWIYKKALKTHTILKQNIGLALLVILCATTPALLGWIPLWIAVILHEGGTVLVGLNSLRLLKK